MTISSTGSDSGIRARTRGGFTLVEVLTAVVLLGVGLVALFYPILTSLDAISYIHTRMDANRLLANHLWTVENRTRQAQAFTLAPRKGEWTAGRFVFGYELVAEALEGVELYHVDAAVSWRSGRRPKRLLRSLYIRVPRAKKD